MSHLFPESPAPSASVAEGFSPSALAAAEILRAAAQALTTTRPSQARPVAELVTRYRAWQQSEGHSPKQIRLVHDRLAALIGAAGWDRSDQISEASLEQAIQTVANTRRGRRGHARPGRETLKKYAQAALQLTRWAAHPRRRLLATDPLAAWEPTEIRESDRRVNRRALSVEHFQSLVLAASSGPPIETLEGLDRAALYVTAASTGLRKGELGSLTPSSFDLLCCRITVQANFSKRRRKDVVSVKPTTMAALAPWIRTRAPGRLLWPISAASGATERDTAKMLELDLARAGIPYEDRDGVADFHALRHCYVTFLARAGVPLAIAQKMARHSDPSLTANIYTHVSRPDEEAAVDRLPEMPVILGGDLSSVLMERGGGPRNLRRPARRELGVSS